MQLDISLLPATMAATALLGLAWDVLAPERLRQAAKPRFLRLPETRARRAHVGPGDAQLATLQGKLQELEATVLRLRQTGHSVVSQRDAARAEAASLRLALGNAQQELARVRQHEEFEFLAKAVLREPPPPTPMVFTAPDPADAGKFRAAKLAFARLYHPDRGGSSEMDRLVRSQVFKEFWAELERIEKSQA